MNYSISQLQKMQDDAMARVRDMQRRANATAAAARADLSPEVPIKKSEPNRPDTATVPSEKKTLKIPDEPKRVPMPSLLPERDKENEKQESDADRAVILALVLLLSTENADMELLLGLMYILCD